MPARNAASFIAQAIASIQQQTDLDWELIVVDDASTDETANIVRAFHDPRIRLLTNETQRGIYDCHNQIVAASHAPYVAHVDADDFILPGALRQMVAALESDPRAGQAHCQFYDIDENGNVLREVLLQRNKMYQRRAQGFDYRRELIRWGTVTSGLRTYPRRVLQELGPFNTQLKYGGDYEMAVRIAEQYEFAFVPQYLYVRRLHARNTTETLSFKNLRYFWQRYHICRALSRSGQVTYFHRKPYRLNRLLASSLFATLGVGRAVDAARDMRYALPRAVRLTLQNKIVSPTLERLYEFAVNHGAWWRLKWRAQKSGHKASLRLAYYVWQFPALSDTFIRREVQGLRDTGIALEVFADVAGEFGDPALAETTHYLLPRNPERLARAKKFFRARSRLRYWNVFLYVVLHRYGSYKTWREDIAVFERALELAYPLREHDITHLHTPWADRTAFIALLAAALLDIPYSVEARAHDLHRFKNQFALREKFSNAKFIITNSDYNARAIEMDVGAAHPPLHVIRELFPLTDFSIPADKQTAGLFRILCVARLIEEKGLVYLLRACARLRERGIPFRCEIIGGPEEPTYVNYLIQLKRLHKHLQLQDSVLFMGAQPFQNILDAYARADLFVLPCVIAENGGRDISPNSLIEAMAMGLPVISTQLSAIPEIVEHGVSGILVPPNDDAALADAIDQLRRDESLRRALGMAARARVQERYDAAKNIAQFAALFRGEAQ
jgi:glycosyltransferase involved in cell wall biosynthesis